ncbi:MAG: DUF1203 domain-containing protein [Caldilineaceae bacterium]
MDTIRFVAMPTAVVEALQSGQPDANGQTPERHISEGDGVPCRHCLTDVAKGEPYLILHHRPFPAPQPYAESGPIFLHAAGCPRYAETAATPPIFLCREDVLLRGYNSEHRIVYGTGQVARTADIANAAQQIFERPEVAYIHARSTTNNCYQCRIERGA